MTKYIAATLLTVGLSVTTVILSPITFIKGGFIAVYKDFLLTVDCLSRWLPELFKKEQQ